MLDDYKKARARLDTLRNERESLAAAVRGGDDGKREALRNASAEIVALSKELSTARREMDDLVAETHTGSARSVN